MELLTAAAEFAASMSAVVSADSLSDALALACERMGVRYFALSHHVDFAHAPDAVRIHNYPDGWQQWYDAKRLALSDPIHRASHFTAMGFYWQDVAKIIPLSAADRRLLVRGREIGLGDGVTVPAHVPGEARGSCTFVSRAGTELPADTLPWAQAIGMCAFEVARRLHRRSRNQAQPRTSERQRQCIALAGRGQSNRVIAGELGIGEQSVNEHLREARARFGVSTRTELVVCLLVARELCLDDVRGQSRYETRISGR
jgi:LuxR family quorum-sensing system transcriptional regulator CciR